MPPMFDCLHKGAVTFAVSALVGSTLLTGSLHAQASTNETASTEAPTPSRIGPPTGWGLSVSGGYAHYFDTRVDSGGSFSKDSALIQAGVRYAFTPERSAALSLGYGFENYNFSGDTGLGGANPWSDLHTLRIGAPVIWGVDEQWTIFAIPIVRFQGEPNANVGDAISGGGFVGFSYKVND